MLKKASCPAANEFSSFVESICSRGFVEMLASCCSSVKSSLRYRFAWKIFALFYCVVLLVLGLSFIWLWRSNDDSGLTIPPGVLPYLTNPRENTLNEKSSKQLKDIKHGGNVNVNSANNKITEKTIKGMDSEVWKELKFSMNVMAVRSNKQKTSEIHSACVVEPLLECNNIGLSALLLLTMEQLAYCHYTLGSTPTVMWRNCHAVCSKNPHFNSWNWYFELVNPAVEVVARKVVCVAKVSAGSPVWLSASFRKRGLPEYDENDLITSETRRAANDIIQRYIKPNKNITRVVEELYINHLHGNNLLGVHVRGTDHISESKGHTLAPVKMWIAEARLILASTPAPSKIFIAGDNSEVLMAFKKELGKDKVFFTRALRAKSYRQAEPPHSYAGRAHVDPQKFGSEVLIDTLLLAKCQNFLHTEASVATLVAFFNPEIRSFFLGELSSENSNTTQSQEPPVLYHEKPSHLSTAALQDDSTNSDEELCFIKNSPASSCPNMAARKFILPAEVRTFLAG